MSALIFNTNDDYIHVATDTLSTFEDGSPRSTTTKAFYVPHLKLIIAGTGIGGFAGEWFKTVNEQMDLNGIQNLDYHTPGALRKQWAELCLQPDFPKHLTTTVYHFGFCHFTGEAIAIAYRSTDSFDSEFLGKGLGIKPAPLVHPEIRETTDFYVAMQQLIVEQTTRPINERIFIGGEAMLIQLSKKGCEIVSLGTL